MRGCAFCIASFLFSFLHQIDNHLMEEYKMAKPFLTTEKIQQYLDVNNKGYKIVSAYTGQNDKIIIKCSSLHPIETTWRLFRSRVIKCSICYKALVHKGLVEETRGKKRKTHEEYVKEVNDIVGEEYIVLGDYKGSIFKIEMEHSKCGYQWDIEANDFLRQPRCPKCSIKLSQGEKRISEWLNEYEITFEPEYSFVDCVYNKPLRFDFAVFNELNELKYLIEYDGEAHFMPIDFAGRGDEWAIENMKGTQLRDSIKNQYCINNNIPLYRFPYWMFDELDEVLNEILNNDQNKAVKNYLIA